VLSQTPELPQPPTSQVTVVARFSDGLAYVRVNNINNSSYTALAVDNNKVYSIKKIGTKVQWLIDNVVVHEENLISVVNIEES
jgi:hypothetical protein